MKSFFEKSLKVISFLISSILVLSIGYSTFVYLLPVCGHFAFSIYNTVSGSQPAEMLLIYIFPMLFLTLVVSYVYIKVSKGIFKGVKKILNRVFNEGVRKSKSYDVLDDKKGRK